MPRTLPSRRTIMSETSSTPTRRSVLAASAAASAASLLGAGPAGAAQENNQENNQDNNKDSALRPFSVHFPEERLVDLRRRINAAIWPEREQVTDSSQGVQLATMQQLARYWGTEH